MVTHARAATGGSAVACAVMGTQGGSAPWRGGALAAALGIGAAVGVLSGLFGIGGGALLVVALVAIGFSQHEAHATSLAAMVLTASAAVIPFALAGEVVLLVAAVLAPTAMLGAYFGAGLMRRIPERELRTGFVIVLLLVAARMATGAGSDGLVDLDGIIEIIGLALLGLATGVLSAVMGIGGGMLMIPILVLLFGFGQHTAEGTSLAVIVPTALVGAWRHTRSGYTDWRRGGLLGVAGIGGGLAGAVIALGLDERLLQQLFAGFLAIMAARLWWSNRGTANAAAADSDDNGEATS